MFSLEKLRELPEEEAISLAASHAGVPPAVVWNMWTQESVRGKSLEGPEVVWKNPDGTPKNLGTAKGHFQVMDHVRAAFTKQYPEVADLDVNKFSDALYLQALHMRENVRRNNGDVSQAVREYVGGLNPARWGDATKDYVQRVAYGIGPADRGFRVVDLGARPVVSTTTVSSASTKNTAPVAVPAAPAEYTSLRYGDELGKPPVSMNLPKPAEAGVVQQARDIERSLVEAVPGGRALLGTIDKFRGGVAESYNIAVQDENSLSYGVVDTVMDTFASDAADAGWSYQNNRETLRKQFGLVEHEMDELDGHEADGKRRVYHKAQALLDRRKLDERRANIDFIPMMLGDIAASVTHNPVDLASAAASVVLGAVLAPWAAIPAAVGKGVQLTASAAAAAARAEKIRRAVSVAQPSIGFAAQGRMGAAAAAAVGEAALMSGGIAALEDTVGRRNMDIAEYGATIGGALGLQTVGELAVLAAFRGVNVRGTVDFENKQLNTHLTATAAAVREAYALDGHARNNDLLAQAMNRDALPDPVGPRFRNDGGVQAALKDWQALETAEIEMASASRNAANGPGTTLKFPGLDVTELDANLPSSTLFPQYGKNVDPIWASNPDKGRIYEALNNADWQKTIGEISGGRVYFAAKKLAKGVHVDEAVTGNVNLRGATQALEGIAKAMLPKSRVIVGQYDGISAPSVVSKNSDGSDAVPNALVVSVGNTHFVGLRRDLAPGKATYAAVHEIGHAVLHERLRDAPEPLLARMVAEHREFLLEFTAGSAFARFKRFARGENVVDSSGEAPALRGALERNGDMGAYIANFDEYGAEAFVRFMERKAMAGGKELNLTAKVVAQVMELFREVRKLYDMAMGKGYLPADTAFDEFFQQILDGTMHSRARMESKVKDLSSASMTSTQAQAMAAKVTGAAEGYMKAHPLDERRLNVIGQLAPNSGALSAGLVLAGSKSPIMQWVASVVTETTTGVGGRGTTVAVRRDTVLASIVGDGMQRYQAAATEWAKAKGYSFRDRYFTGQAQKDFDREVYRAARIRAAVGTTGQRTAALDPMVERGLDHATGLYQRSADLNRKAGTAGSALLPKSSANYIPQRLDGTRILAASREELTAVHSTLSSHWQQFYEWDKTFSDALARLYIDRAGDKATGGMQYGAKQVDSGGIGDVRSAVREVVASGKVTTVIGAKALQKLEKTPQRGQKPMLDRLDIPMTAKIGEKEMVDFFYQDQLSLMHRHAQAASGEIALVEMGIPGEAGLRNMRIAAEVSRPAPSLREFQAFDQVTAELFGRAAPNSAYRESMQTLRLTTSVLKLGGVVWNQLAETNNAIHALGVKAAARMWVKLIPEYVINTRALGAGKAVANPFLKSLETPGGELGMHNYRINFPLKASDELLSEYSESPGFINSLMKNLSQTQQKISFFRGVSATQHRMTAEEIVRKSAKMITKWQPGSEVPRAMQDMGFTKELLAAYKAAPGAVTLDRWGFVQGFDLQAVPDKKMQEAYAQAVHRGTKQIIQGTFVGERNAWVHDEWMQILAQFRTFSAVAAEKQWARTRFQKDSTVGGYAYLGGVLAMQAGLAVPIYLARVQSQALLMDDVERDDFLEKRTSWDAITRGVMNYSSVSGFTGDLFEVAIALGGETMGVEGARGTGGKGRLTDAIPAVGVVNQVGKVGQNLAEAVQDEGTEVKLDQALKTLPLSSVWWIVPFINMVK